MPSPFGFARRLLLHSSTSCIHAVVRFAQSHENSLIVQGCTGAVKHRDVRERPRRSFKPPLAESESAVLQQPANCTSIPALACPSPPGLGLPSTNSCAISFSPARRPAKAVLRQHPGYWRNLRARRTLGIRFSAWSTGWPCVLCAGRPSCARPHVHHGSQSPPCVTWAAILRRIPSAPGLFQGG